MKNQQVLKSKKNYTVIKLCLYLMIIFRVYLKKFKPFVELH